MNYLNPIATAFNDVIDEKNNHQTIVCDWSTEELYKIDVFGFQILKHIYLAPGIPITELWNILIQTSPEYKEKYDEFVEFVEFMRGIQVIISSSPYLIVQQLRQDV